MCYLLWFGKRTVSPWLWEALMIFNLISGDWAVWSNWSPWIVLQKHTCCCHNCGWPDGMCLIYCIYIYFPLCLTFLAFPFSCAIAVLLSCNSKSCCYPLRTMWIIYYVYSKTWLLGLWLFKSQTIVRNQGVVPNLLTIVAFVIVSTCSLLLKTVMLMDLDCYV